MEGDLVSVRVSLIRHYWKDGENAIWSAASDIPSDVVEKVRQEYVFLKVSRQPSLELDRHLLYFFYNDYSDQFGRNAIQFTAAYVRKTDAAGILLSNLQDEVAASALDNLHVDVFRKVLRPAAPPPPPPPPPPASPPGASPKGEASGKGQKDEQAAPDPPDKPVQKARWRLFLVIVILLIALLWWLTVTILGVVGSATGWACQNFPVFNCAAESEDIDAPEDTPGQDTADQPEQGDLDADPSTGFSFTRHAPEVSLLRFGIPNKCEGRLGKAGQWIGLSERPNFCIQVDLLEEMWEVETRSRPGFKRGLIQESMSFSEGLSRHCSIVETVDAWRGVSRLLSGPPHRDLEQVLSWYSAETFSSGAAGACRDLSSYLRADYSELADNTGFDSSLRLATGTTLPEDAVQMIADTVSCTLPTLDPASASVELSTGQTPRFETCPHAARALQYEKYLAR